MRLKVPEVEGLIIDSSIHRMEAIGRHPPPKNAREVIEVLSDQTDNDYRVYQDIRPEDFVKTIATGIKYMIFSITRNELLDCKIVINEMAMFQVSSISLHERGRFTPTSRAATIQ